MKHIFQQTKNKIVTIMAAFDAGARAEGQKYSPGLAHMLEHMIFKGTTKRSCYDIAREIAFLGGSSNAFTSHEMVCFYIRVPYENFEAAAEILSDMVFHSTLPEDEFTKEREVVFEEAMEYKDDPSYELHQLFHNEFFQGRLATDIIGTEDSIKGFSHKELKDFYEEFYISENGILAISGNIPQELAEIISSRYFDAPTSFKKTTDSNQSSLKDDGVGFYQISDPDLEQTQLIIAYPGLIINEDETPAAICLLDILGGGTDSRLWIEAREKNSLCYHINLQSMSHLECGAWIISSSINHRNLDKMLDIIEVETSKIKTELISDEELQRTKNKFKADIYGIYDSGYSLISDALNREFFGSIPLDTVSEQINTVTKEDIMSLANRIFTDKQKVFVLSSEDVVVEEE